MAVYLSPLFGAGAQLFDSQGRVLAGGTINTYLAGTTTPQQTYADNLGITPNSVNISLDSAGRPSQEIWLTGGIKYKFIVLSSTAVQQGPTYDNISGVNDPGTGAVTGTDWIAGTTPTYISATQFSVTGDQRTTYAIGRRIKATITAGTAYATVSAVSFASVTTVTVVVDSTVLDSGLSAVWYGIDGTLNPSVDAIGTTYKDTIAPPSSPVSVSTVAQRVDRANRLHTTGGTGAAYTLTPTPALAAYATNAPLLIKFHADASGTPTLAVSGLSALSLKQIDTTGAKVAATVKTGQISEVVYDGTDLVALVPVTVAAPAPSSYPGRFLRTTVYTAAGTSTWTKGTDVGAIYVQCVAGGAGGTNTAGTATSYGTSGGAGGYFEKRISSPGATETVVIGTGGANTGASGGNTVFGTWGTASGGSTPTGGTASGGDVNMKGGAGILTPTTAAAPGGASAFGGEGAPGSGGADSGAGISGIAIVQEYSSS